MKTANFALLLMLSVCFFSFRAFEKRVSRKRIFHTAISGTPYIIINKSDYEMEVYDNNGWYATYPVVFGSKDLDDKMMEGDRKTPEGTYRIVAKRPHEKWSKILMIDYPTKADLQKFSERKAAGLIPRDARIGSGIGIHGTWLRDEVAVDNYQNWTNGCISMKREQVTEVYDMIPVGTKVIIRP